MWAHNSTVCNQIFSKSFKNQEINSAHNWWHKSGNTPALRSRMRGSTCYLPKDCCCCCCCCCWARRARSWASAQFLACNSSAAWPRCTIVSAAARNLSTSPTPGSAASTSTELLADTYVHRCESTCKCMHPSHRKVHVKWTGARLLSTEPWLTTKTSTKIQIICAKYVGTP